MKVFQKIDIKSKVLEDVVSTFFIIAIPAGLIGLIFISRTVGMAGFIIYSLYIVWNSLSALSKVRLH